jgi:quercetin dioxygenase-like cupin family protein
MTHTQTLTEPHFVTPNSRLPRSHWYMNALMTIHADGADTNGQFALVEVKGKPGSEPPLHVHEHEDELFVVLEGQIKAICDGVEKILNPGDSAFLPRHIPHTFRILTPEARALVYITPAGFENYFKEMSQPAESLELPANPVFPELDRLVAMTAKYGIEILGGK